MRKAYLAYSILLLASLLVIAIASKQYIRAYDSINLSLQSNNQYKVVVEAYLWNLVVFILFVLATVVIIMILKYSLKNSLWLNISLFSIAVVPLLFTGYGVLAGYKDFRISYKYMTIINSSDKSDYKKVKKFTHEWLYPKEN